MKHKVDEVSRSEHNEHSTGSALRSLRRTIRYAHLIRFLALALTVGLCPFAGAQEYVWSKAIGGGSSSPFSTRGPAVDGAGNVYTIGRFSSTRDFDPGPGAFLMTPVNGSDAYVLKLNRDGEFQWAGQFGGSDIVTSPEAIAVSRAGDVHLTGLFRGTADFDPGAGNYSLTAVGAGQNFVLKLDSAGGFLWAAATEVAPVVGGITGRTLAGGIALDAEGNVHVTGQFRDTLDFDPGSGVAILTAVGWDIFVYKLDSLGRLQWARAMGGNNNDYGCGIAVDSLGNVITTGSFEGSGDFDPGTGSAILSGGIHDVFVSKLDRTGQFIWARGMGGPQSDKGRGVTLDSMDRIWITGSFELSGDFDPGPGTFALPASGLSDGFVAALTSGGDFIWAGALGGSSWDYGYAIATDNRDGVFVTGVFSVTGDFDPGVGSLPLTSAGAWDVFVLKLNSGGGVEFGLSFGGALLEVATGIAVDSNGTIVTAGEFTGVVDFDPGPGTAALSSGATKSAYILKLSPPGIPELSVTQPGGPGTSLFVDHTNLVVGNSYFNLLSFSPCTNGLGSGPVDTLGLCLTTPASLQSIVSQLMLPLGTPPYHIAATSAAMSWGPYTLAPGTYEAISFEATGGVIGLRSDVIRFVVQ